MAYHLICHSEIYAKNTTQYRISSIQVGSVLNMALGYDANGNITSKTDTNPAGGQPPETPETYEYQTGTNKLVHIYDTPDVDFGYDANGNITSENTWTYAYDLSNQLIRVLDGTNQIAEYVYNGAGQRIMKVTLTETRVFHYDQFGHLIAETNQSGQMLAEYIYLGDQLLAMIKPGELVYYFHNDHLRKPQVLTNESQGIAWKAAYTPFGQAAISLETVENPFRLPGQYYDEETGLHYNYRRYYDPTIGRYVTPDPLGLEKEENPYLYSRGNPIRFFDPFGLFSLAEAVWRYFTGGGPVNVDFSEVDIGLQPRDFPGYLELVQSMYKQYGRLAGIDIRLLKDIGGFAGETTYRLRGDIFSNPCEWSFVGYIGAYDDVFDFNDLPWGTREYWKEIIVRVLGRLPFGKIYDIHYVGRRLVKDGGKW